MNRPALPRPTPRAAAFAALSALFILFACHLGTTPETQETFTFPTLKGKIGDADHVLIQLRDSTGKVVDVLYDDTVNSATTFEDLPTRQYDGGKIFIYIEATKNGVTTYKVQRGYDPAQGGNIPGEVIVYVDPSKIPKEPDPEDTLPKDTTARPRLQVKPDTLTLALRGPSGRLTHRFIPDTAAKPLRWTALDAGIEVSQDGLVTPGAQGFHRVAAASQADSTVADTALVQVLPVQAVDSVRFAGRSGNLLLVGASDSLAAIVFPPLAPQGVTLSVRDTAIVRLQGSIMRGLAEGETRVFAYSQENPLRRDSLTIVVLSPKPVDSVRLREDTLKLFVGAEGASLTPSIYPADLQGLYLWTSQNPAVATVGADGRVTPAAEGQTQVVVRAWADTTRRDQVVVIVRKDAPRIQAGNDTIMARGSTLVHAPSVTQDYGQVKMFKWDLDGNGAFEDSSVTVPASLPYAYVEAKEYLVRFYARDSEGNETVQTRRVRAVSGRVVQITSPRDGSSTNQGSVTVTWTVDGVPQSNNETLRAGINVITRSSRDSAGNDYSHSISVTLDQTAPNRPLVKGPAAPVNTVTPRWSWASTDTSGNGIFRFRLDNPELSASAGVSDTEYVATSGLQGGLHTLYVQERDEAGNWSLSGSFAIRIDTTAPAAPTVQTQPASPTNETRPTWTWSGGPGDALRYYRFKLDDGDFRSGARDTLAAAFRPSAPLSEGPHTLYVQARDSAGNWSGSGSAAIRIDITAPTAPTVSGPASPTNDDTPTWTWTAGSGGNGSFRYRLDDTIMTSATATTLLTYTAATLVSGSHTLHVQERDSAGNWSARGSYSVTVDRTAPNAPTMNLTSPRSPLNSLRPTWSWTSGGGGNGTFQVKIGNDDFSTGATTVSATSFTPPSNLQQGAQTLYVRERDAAQNWSAAASRSIFLAPRDTLGGLGFSTNGGTAPMILVTSTGVIYSAFLDLGVDAIVVKRYQPGTDTWSDAGAGLDIGSVADFVMGPGDVPYIVGNNHVQRLVGSTWQDVGDSSTNATRLLGSYHSLAFSSTGTPYLAFSEFASGFKATLMRYSGVGWDVVNVTRIGIEPWYLKLAIGTNNRPYMAFQDLRGMGIYVVTTDPSNYSANWDTVGSGSAFNNSSTISGLKVRCHSNQIYLGIRSSDAEAIKLLSSSGSGFTTIQSVQGTEFDFEVGSTGIPYLAIVQGSLNDHITVMGRINSGWVNVGAMHQSAGVVSNPSLVITGDGVPHVGFYDQAAGGKPSVIRTAFDP